MGVVPDIDGATPVPGGPTTCVLESTAHRTRDRDIHAAVTRSVIRRRVGRHSPGRRARPNNSRDNAYHYQYGAAFMWCERVGRRGLASVDRRRLLRAADLIELTITAALLRRFSVLPEFRHACPSRIWDPAGLRLWRC
jgi:hypothetical protein